MSDNNAQTPVPNSDIQDQSAQATNVPTEGERAYREGLKYLLGMGVEKNYSLAFDYFVEANKLDYDKATYQLAQMYLEGNERVQQNIEYAVRFFRIAANQGNALAAYALSKMYLKREGEAYSKIIEGDVKIEQWLKLAAVSYIKEAQYRLGEMYYTGKHELRQDFKEAKQWLSGAARDGHREAIFLLGEMYQRGLVTFDGDSMQQAIAYYTLAANKGHREAQYRLGWINYEGYTIIADFEEARKWFKLAAAQGHSEAQHKLDLMDADGEGLEQNAKQA